MAGEYRFWIDGRIPVLKLHYEPRPRPAVVVLHGYNVDVGEVRRELDSLADHGLTAVGVDAPHHGLRRDGWLEEVDPLPPAEFFPRFLGLVLQAVPEVSRVVDYLVQEGHGPIGLVGVSMGAYIGLAAAARDARIAATVSLLGSPDWRPRQGPVTPELAELMSHAPVHRPAELARNPLLFVNASRDASVPPDMARDFTRRLAQSRPDLAVHVTYLEYPDSGHLMRPEDWEDGWRRTLGFLRQHLA
jgi:pimeloyl-ACP methyl ester carboxylesterase